MTWFHFALLSVLTNGTFIFLTKRSFTKTNIDPVAVNFVLFLFATITTLPFFLVSLTKLPTLFTAPMGLVIYLILVVINIFGFKYYFESLSLNDLSIVGPLDNLRPLFVVALSIPLLGQLPTPMMFLGILLIITGALAIQLKSGLSQFLITIRHSRATHLIIASTFLFSLGNILDKKLLSYTTPEIDAFLSVAALLVVFAIMVFTKRRQASIPNIFQPTLILSGVLVGAGFLLLITANKLSSPNHIIPVMMTRSLFLAILGFVFLGEKGYVRKIVSALIMIAGVLLLVQ